MRFFTKEKLRLGAAHAEYAQYWIEKPSPIHCLSNVDYMPNAALRLSAGMLPPHFFAGVTGAINLHEARLQDVIVSDNELWLVLLSHNYEETRKVTIQYTCSRTFPKIGRELFGSTLRYHEFQFFNGFFHDILFDSGVELRIGFNKIVIGSNTVV